jgi:hypothetical protein
MRCCGVVVWCWFRQSRASVVDLVWWCGMGCPGAPERARYVDTPC